LTVWQVSGDGDCLAIGGNHFIHACRRNVNINMLIVNNRIYGLTKGQYSPTSPKGFVSKSSPFGTVERPFRPAELVMGARGTFFARTLDVDGPTSVMVMKAAAAHKGYSVCECLCNCVIFNNGANNWIATKEDRLERTVVLEHGKPMIFGKDRNKGLVLDGWNLKVVTIGENGVTENDILVHDATTEDPTLHLKLALMDGPDMPIAMGVIRAVPTECYDEAVHNQIKEVQEKAKCHTFDELLGTLEQWDM
jgi:2-oxoglutarate ferredoxin oxidoreductase subunit beta